MVPLFQVSVALTKHVSVDPLIVKQGFLEKGVKSPSLQRSSSSGAAEQAGGCQKEHTEAFCLPLKTQVPELGEDCCRQGNLYLFNLTTCYGLLYPQWLFINPAVKNLKIYLGPVARDVNTNKLETVFLH